ncbi:MAG: hypothetical protein AAB427_06395, partial [Chloroflexota bacterium]
MAFGDEGAEAALVVAALQRVNDGIRRAALARRFVQHEPVGERRFDHFYGRILRAERGQEKWIQIGLETAGGGLEAHHQFAPARRISRLAGQQQQGRGGEIKTLV